MFHDGQRDCDAVKFNYDRWLKLPADYAKLEYTYSTRRPVVARSAAAARPSSPSRSSRQFLLTQP
jgi:hypothetical protein